MASDRPNYFLLLGFDLDVPWDAAAFEKRLKTKRGEWSRDVTNGVQGSRKVLTARQALDHLDDMKLVMADENRRKQELADARARLADEDQRRHVELELRLTIMLSKGFLWDAEVTALRRDFPDLTSDPELAERLDHLPTHVLAEQYAVPDRLDQSKANGIRGLLDSLGEKSLYTLLAGVDRDITDRSSLDRLTDAANALYRQTQQKMNKHDIKLEAKQQLAGHAMQVFKTAHERTRYDNTLMLAPVVGLIEKYQTALGAIRRFEADQVDRFLAEASTAGVAADVALAMLLKHFGDMKWPVQLPANVTGGTHRDQVRCEACRSWNDTEYEFCAACGVRLRITCPKCDRTVSGHGACGRCGFPVGDHDWAALLLHDCAESVDRQDLAGAERRLAEAAGAWPSEGDDELAVRLKECRERVALLRQERTAQDANTARQLRALVEQRNYQAVYRRATNAPVTVPDRERVITESAEHIEEADRLCDLAERATTTREQSDYYAQALAQCADHWRAERALGALPPHRPKDLHVESTDREVRLSWTPSDSDHVRYLVVRKAGAQPPASVTDGSRLAVLRRTTYLDRAPERGVPLHYAVFAQRATGISSDHGATTTSPIFLTSPVTVTSRRVDDGVVELRWELPVHATGVFVQRTTAGRTIEVTATEPTRLHDAGLANGVSHTYIVRANYSNPRGADHLSTGVSVTLIPGPPPPPPGPVHVRTVTRNLGVCYRLVDLLPQGAAAGTANVLWTQARPTIRPGDQYPVTDLAKHGALLTESAAQSFALPRPGLYYFAQVVISNGVGYVGDIRRYAARDEVGELAARDYGDVVRLTWNWPDGCAVVLVAYDHDDWPPDPTVAPHRTLVERVGNDPTGWYDIIGANSRHAQKFHFVVAAAERSDDEVFVTTGSRCTAQLNRANPAPQRRRARR